MCKQLCNFRYRKGANLWIEIRTLDSDAYEREGALSLGRLGSHLGSQWCYKGGFDLFHIRHRRSKHRVNTTFRRMLPTHVPVLGAGGPRFESGRPDCIKERPCNTLRVGGFFFDWPRSDTFIVPRAGQEVGAATDQLLAARGEDRRTSRRPLEVRNPYPTTTHSTIFQDEGPAGRLTPWDSRRPRSSVCARSVLPRWRRAQGVAAAG